MTFHNACRAVPSFCLTEDGAQMFLSKEHAYFYQMQTQMHVTDLHWCDFVIWSPIQEPFVQHATYINQFIDRIPHCCRYSALQNSEFFDASNGPLDVDS